MVFAKFHEKKTLAKWRIHFTGVGKSYPSHNFLKWQLTDLGQSPIQSAQILIACLIESNQTLTIIVVSKMHSNEAILFFL